MATLTSAVITIPSFTGLKAVASTKANNCTAAAKAPAPSMHLCKASLKEVAVAVAAFSASALLTSNALAMEVLLGGNDGSLVFVPSEFKVASGEKIVFRNNAGFPHNVMFYEDQVPAGVDVSKISMGEDELLNAPNEIYSVTLDIKGAYGFYCYPHEGAGMVGTLTVN